MEVNAGSIKESIYLSKLKIKKEVIGLQHLNYFPYFGTHVRYCHHFESVVVVLILCHHSVFSFICVHLPLRNYLVECKDPYYINMIVLMLNLINICAFVVDLNPIWPPEPIMQFDWVSLKALMFKNY